MDKEELLKASKKSCFSTFITMIVFMVAYTICIFFVPFAYRSYPDGAIDYISLFDCLLRLAQGYQTAYEELEMITVPLITHGVLIAGLALINNGITMLNHVEQVRLGFDLNEIHKHPFKNPSFGKAIAFFVVGSIITVTCCICCSLYIEIGEAIVKPIGKYVYSPFSLFFIVVILIYNTLQFINIIILHSLLKNKSEDEIDPDLF